MRNIVILLTDNDDKLIKEIIKYRNFKNRGSGCCRKSNLIVSFDWYLNKLKIIVESNSEIGECLHYYAITSIIQEHGNQILDF